MPPVQSSKCRAEQLCKLTGNLPSIYYIGNWLIIFNQLLSKNIKLHWFELLKCEDYFSVLDLLSLGVGLFIGQNKLFEDASLPIGQTINKVFWNFIA